MIGDNFPFTMLLEIGHGNGIISLALAHERSSLT
jgi:hypothetical protein